MDIEQRRDEFNAEAKIKQIHTHPIMERQLGVDDKHVIIDKDTYWAIFEQMNALIEIEGDEDEAQTEITLCPNDASKLIINPIPQGDSEVREKIARIYCQNCRDKECDDRCNCETCYEVAEAVLALTRIEGDEDGSNQ